MTVAELPEQLLEKQIGQYHRDQGERGNQQGERAGLPDRSRKWWVKYIPRTWYAIEERGGSDPRYSQQYRDPRYAERERELDLDDTRSMRRRYEDNSAPPGPKVQVPFGVIITVVIYLIGQLVGGVWWAATLQSNLQHEIADRAKEESRLWDSIQTYRAEVNALRIEIARLSGPRSRQTNEHSNEDN